MKFRAAALALLLVSVAAAQVPPSPPAAAQPPPPAPAAAVVEAAAQRTVSVRFADYQRLQDKRRELEERLGRDGAGRALDAVIARAHYDVELRGETAVVTARFDVKTLRPDGWKLLPLVGGAVSVSRFEPPMKDAFLVVREMLPSPVGLQPGVHYLLTEGSESGELVLEFMVPVVAEGGVKRVQFMPPGVPLSTLEMTVPDADLALSMEPGARITAMETRPGGGRHVKASLRGGEALTISLARPEPVASPGPSTAHPPAAAPKPDLAVDQLHAQWAITDTHVRLRERLVVDVRTVPVERLVLRKPSMLSNVSVREENGSTLLDESMIGKPFDPDGRAETIELKLRAPVAGKLVRLALAGDLRSDPDQTELVLNPITVDNANTLVEGFATVTSQLPHAVTLDRAEGARGVALERLPYTLAGGDAPILVAAELTAPSSILFLHQQVLPHVHTTTGAIQRLDVLTDLGGTSIRTRYRALVSPGPEGAIQVTLPDSNWTLADVHGTVPGDIPTVKQGTYLLRVKPGAPDPASIEFEVKHTGEALRLTGDVSLPLARFNVPARNVAWSVQEPDHMRFWGWRGSFAESGTTHEFFLHRFAIGLWSWAWAAFLGLLEPASLFWIMVVLVGLTVARSAALGRLPLDASMGQLAFLAGIVVLGAVFIHVLTNAANPGPALSDARDPRVRDERVEGGARPPAPNPPPPSAPRGLDALGERRTLMADDTMSAAPTRMDAAPVPQPAAPPPQQQPVVASAPPVRSNEPTMRADTSPAVSTAVPPATGAGGTAPAATSGPAASASAAPPAAPAPSSAPDGRGPWVRPVILPQGEGPSLALEATYIERRLESLGTALAMMMGLALFLALFLAVRQMLDVPTTNVIAAVGVLVLWLMDSRYPFTATYAAAGFGLPVLLLGSVKLMGHALDTWDAWREEGERYSGRAGDNGTRADNRGGGSWSASFPRSGDKNEVAIKEIFTEPPPQTAPPAAVVASAAAPSAGSDEISFVSEDDDAGDEAQGGEPR